jgi:hypothetical protein
MADKKTSAMTAATALTGLELRGAQSGNDVKLVADGALGIMRRGFRVSKNADQAGVAAATTTLVTWQTEAFDIGSHFASNAWTPPAGLVLINASFSVIGTWSAGSVLAILLYKNGAQLQNLNWPAQLNNGGSCYLTAVDVADGDDVYDIRAYITAGGTVANAATTVFSGVWLGPVA